MIKYLIKEFNEITGSIVVDIMGLNVSIDVPIMEDNTFMSGEILNKYISNIINNLYKSLEISNSKDIIALISKPILDIKDNKEDINENILYKLKASDWTQLKDNKLDIETKNAWNKYRKLLRDLLSSEIFNNIVLPISPLINARLWSADKYKLEVLNLLPNISTYIEVGTYRGEGIINISEEFPNLSKIYSIDNYIPYIDEYATLGQLDPNNMPENIIDICYYVSEEQALLNKKIALDRVNNSTYKNKIELIYKDSLEASKDFKDDSIDVIFLDSYTNLDKVAIDIKAWLPKVSIKGILCGYEWSEKTSVIPTIELALLNEYSINKLGHMWYIIKKDKNEI